MPILRRSQYAHVVELGDNRALLIHALSQLRLPVDAEIVRLMAWFDAERSFPEKMPQLADLMGYDAKTLAGCLAALIERGMLTEKSAAEEAVNAAADLNGTQGRDPEEMLARYRRARKEGVHPYWSATVSRSARTLGSDSPRLELLLFGDCEIQMEADFLRREAERRGIDLRVAATFASDAALAGERSCDAIVIGALQARHAIATGPADDGIGHYIAQARALLRRLRGETAAPIFLDNLPEPTVEPFGLADRGFNSHRNRFRRANLALAELAEEFTDAYIIDICAALASAGSARLLDDGLNAFTHFGSPGWMLQRPESEKAAVHDMFPDLAPLALQLDGNPYAREEVTAVAHMDALTTVLGIDRKKCVIVDLDGVLWPGVLAETGAPFAWHPEVSGAHSYVGLYFGIHEALKILKRRGVVLAAVSKNDEQTVRELWRFAEHYPRERLLLPEDFVTWRVNWSDKVENIRSIGDELGFALSSFIFIDDHPVERARVNERLPEVETWGEDLFALRRRLLSDPRLQLPAATEESGRRTELVRAQLARTKLQAELPDEEAFLASLAIECDIGPLRDRSKIERVRELFARTTQFNTTGRKFTTAELTELLDEDADAIFTLDVRDCFGDQGLVGAAVVIAHEIVGFALSCRVIGLGVERKFLAAILNMLGKQQVEISARIVETPRNLVARNLYRDQGFTAQGNGLWRFALRDTPMRAVA